jgi:hypothetical protein
MKENLKTLKKELLSFPKMLKDPTSNEQDAITWHWNFLKKFDGFENELRLFISIHENEGKDISPKLMRKEVLGE